MKNSACSSENSNWMRLHCKCRLKLMCSSFPWVNARFPPRTEKWDFLLYRVHACFSLFFVGKAVRRILFRLPKKTVQKCLTLEGNKKTKNQNKASIWSWLEAFPFPPSDRTYSWRYTQPHMAHLLGPDSFPNTKMGWTRWWSRAPTWAGFCSKKI